MIRSQMTAGIERPGDLAGHSKDRRPAAARQKHVRYLWKHDRSSCYSRTNSLRWSSLDPAGSSRDPAEPRGHSPAAAKEVCSEEARLDNAPNWPRCRRVFAGFFPTEVWRRLCSNCHGAGWRRHHTMLRTLFILSIFVPGFYAALRSRYFALLMYLWFALFRPQDWIWIDITSLRLSMVLGIILLVPALLGGRFPNVTHPLSIGMLSFVASTLLSQFTAVRPDLGWPWVDFTFRLVLTCTLLVTLSSDRMRLFGVVAVVACSLGFHASKAGLAYAVGGGTRFADGLSGAFIDNNGYALGTVMIIPLLLVTAQNVDALYSGRWLPWLKRGLLLALPLCVLAVIGTYSRGGFVALAAATLTYIMLQRRRIPALTGLVSGARARRAVRAGAAKLSRSAGDHPHLRRNRRGLRDEPAALLARRAPDGTRASARRRNPPIRTGLRHLRHARTGATATSARCTARTCRCSRSSASSAR